jgi:hypothetical protein
MSRISFTDQPATVGESYLQHMGVAGSFGWAMLKGAGACFVHALLPFLFVKTGSATITGLHDRMVLHRRRAPLPETLAAAE